MPAQKINIGAAPNDKTGDSLREAFALTNAAIDQVNANTAAIEGKVDKAPGMGLSQNSFTNEQRDKLNGLEDSHWRGTFLSVSALQAALPRANAGDYADVDAGAESDVQRYIWDVSDAEWVQQGAATTITAAQVKDLYESNSDTNAFSDAERQKLGGLESGATKNATDAQLRDRSTHTGTQAIGTIKGLESATAAHALAAFAFAKTFADVPTTNQGAMIVVTQPHLRFMVWNGAAYVRALWHQPGMVMYSYGNSPAIPGYLPMRADVVYQKADYPDLMARLGHDLTGTFTLLETRGEFIRVLDNGRGVDPSRAPLSAQADMLKSHSHDVGLGLSSAAYTAQNSTFLGSGSHQTQPFGGTETRPRNVPLMAWVSY